MNGDVLTHQGAPGVTFQELGDGWIWGFQRQKCWEFAHWRQVIYICLYMYRYKETFPGHQPLMKQENEIHNGVQDYNKEFSLDISQLENELYQSSGNWMK